MNSLRNSLPLALAVVTLTFAAAPGVAGAQTAGELIVSGPLGEPIYGPGEIFRPGAGINPYDPYDSDPFGRRRVVVQRSCTGPDEARKSDEDSDLDAERRADDAARGVSSASSGRDDGKAEDKANPIHGEVWAGIGTGGYRRVGASACKKLGDNGEVRMTVDRTEGSRWYGAIDGGLGRGRGPGRH